MAFLDLSLTRRSVDTNSELSNFRALRSAVFAGSTSSDRGEAVLQFGRVPAQRAHLTSRTPIAARPLRESNIGSIRRLREKFGDWSFSPSKS